MKSGDHEKNVSFSCNSCRVAYTTQSPTWFTKAHRLPSPLSLTTSLETISPPFKVFTPGLPLQPSYRASWRLISPTSPETNIHGTFLRPQTSLWATTRLTPLPVPSHNDGKAITGSGIFALSPPSFCPCFRACQIQLPICLLHIPLLQQAVSFQLPLRTDFSRSTVL